MKVILKKLLSTRLIQGSKESVLNVVTQEVWMLIVQTRAIIQIVLEVGLTVELEIDLEIEI